MSPEQQVGVQLSGLSVEVGRGRSKRRAVDRLDLEIGLGIHGLLGPNGAGKTTLMRTMASILGPAAGQLRLLGLDPTDGRQRRELRRQLGYLPQTFGCYPRFTVREFVSYFAWLKEVPSARAELAVDLAIDRVGLSDRADSRMKALSGGMLRRAGLAQALVNTPRVLLLDEPTAGLDPEQRLDFRALLRELGLDTCIVISTHLVEDVASACDFVTLIDEGRLVTTGTPADLERLGRQPIGDDVGSLEDRPGVPLDGASVIERGYTSAMRGYRARRNAGSTRGRD